ncbi:type IV secretion system protein [Kribbella kalugense]|nr:type IV secretion system protein [Kribbella kalugense]
MDMKCHVVDAVQSLTNGWFQNANKMSADFFSTALNSLATFWVKPKTPVALATPNDDGTWTNSGTVQFVHDKTLALTLTIFSLAIVIAGLRMAWERRARPLQELLKAMLTFVVVCGCGTAAVQVMVEWSDAFSVDVVTSALGGDSFSTAVMNLMSAQNDRGSTAGITSYVMLILLAQMATFASLIQIVLMLIRSAMLVILGATLPLAAAATNTEVGKAWFKKYCAWTLGFIAYKPAAALIYAAAIKLKDEDMLGSGSGLTQSLTALMMMMLAILAMPALLRFAVPVTAAVGGGSAGMGAVGPDVGGMATGALNVGSSGGGRGVGGGSGGGGGAAATSGGGPSGAGGGAATGAKMAGGAALGPVGIAATAARKAAGAFAGAASHSAGESGGGGGSGSFAPRPSGGGGGGRSTGGGSGGGRPKSAGSSSSGSGGKTPAGAGVGGGTGGPSGNW